MCPKDSNLTIGLEIRKAICYTIDREDINQVVHSGESVINDYPKSYNLGIWKNLEIIRYTQNIPLATYYFLKTGHYTPYSGSSFLIENIGIIYSLSIMIIISLFNFKIIKKKQN